MVKHFASSSSSSSDRSSFQRWIQDNQVLDIVLRDCLHQPQYVEKLDRLLRFLIKEQGLSRTDLDKIWSASSGKHEAIEKNIHDLLAKLAWDFSPEQLEQLFDCFRVRSSAKISLPQILICRFGDRLGKLDQSE